MVDGKRAMPAATQDGKTAVSLAKDRAITAPYDSDYWSDLLLDTSSGTSSDTSSDTSSGTSSGSSSDSVSTSDWSDIDADSLDAYETNQEVLKLVRHHGKRTHSLCNSTPSWSMPPFH